MIEGWPDDMTLWDQLFGLISIQFSIQFHRSSASKNKNSAIFFFFFNFISNLTKKSFIFFYYIPDPVGNVHLLDGDLLIFVIYVKCWFCLLVSEWTCESRFSRLIQRIWVFFCCFSCKLKLNGLAKLVYLATIHYIKFDIRFLLNCIACHKFILTIMTLNIYLFIYLFVACEYSRLSQKKHLHFGLKNSILMK